MFRRDKRGIDPTIDSSGRLVLGDRMSTFRRLYRWVNLTFVQQGIWPLLVLITTAPAVKVEYTPFPWYWARLGAPVAAALLALLYLRQALPKEALVSPEDSRMVIEDEPQPPPSSMLATQARFLLCGLPLALAVARLIQGPTEPASKLIFFGLAQVASFHLINFGVVPRSYADRYRGLLVGTLLFAVSWGLHDAFETGVANDNTSLYLAFFSGLVVGGLVALLSRGLMRWPGGRYTAPAVHWLLIYLVIGFV